MEWLKAVLLLSLLSNFAIAFPACPHKVDATAADFEDECLDDWDCPGDYLCRLGFCVEYPEPLFPYECTFDQDCNWPYERCLPELSQCVPN